MRTPIIVGNWKMNNGPEAADKFYKEFSEIVKNSKIEINCEWAIAAPYISMISLMSQKDEDLYVPIAAQNVHQSEKGAFTGEISLGMLDEYGIEYIIVGHSERREFFNETNETVNLKIKNILDNSDITPIMAFGETEKEFDSGITKDVVKKQLNEGLKDLNKEEIERLVLAYEPIWAIGTGKTATPQQAQDIIKYSREIVSSMYGKDIAEKIRIQYGGSMNPGNVKELMAQPDIDGGLVGGASLDPKSFFELITFDKK